MKILQQLICALRSDRVQVLDLTTPLCETTPIIQLPADHGQPWPFERELISKYDARGPLTYWNNVRLSEHTGTHFDAPVHWLSGRELADVSQIPVQRLVASAAVLDFSAEAAADPDFLLRREHVERWIAEHGALPHGGWLLYRTGWDNRAGDPVKFLNDGHTPGIEPECACWLSQAHRLVGIGVETVGTDAGMAAHFPSRAYPCHWYFQGSGKYGLTQLRNLALLPTQGAVIIAGPLPIVGGSGSPTRVLALVEVAENSGMRMNGSNAAYE